MISTPLSTLHQWFVSTRLFDRYSISTLTTITLNQPEDIYRQLLENAQRLYKQYQVAESGPKALMGKVKSMELILSGSTQTLKAQTVPLIEPVLVYDVVNVMGRDALQANVVWPPRYEEQTRPLRDNRGGVMGDHIQLQANQMVVFGHSHANVRSDYDAGTLSILGGEVGSGKEGLHVHVQQSLNMIPVETQGNCGVAQFLRATITSEGQAHIHASDFNLVTAKIHSGASGSNTMILHGNNAHLNALTTTQILPTGSTQHAHVTHISAPNGGMGLYFTETLTGQAPHLIGQSIHGQAGTIDIIDMLLLTMYTWKEKTGKWWNKKEKTITQEQRTSQVAVYDAQSVSFEALSGDNRHVAPQSTAQKLTFTAHGDNQVRLELARQYLNRVTQEKSSNIVWKRQKVTQEEHVTYVAPQLEGEVTISGNAVVEVVKDLTRRSGISNQLMMYGTTVTKVDEQHQYNVQKSSGPSGVLSALMALAITIGTAELGAPIAVRLGLAGNTRYGNQSSADNRHSHASYSWNTQ